VKQFSILDFGFSIVKSTSKNVFCLALSASLLTLSLSVAAQQPPSVIRVGFLHAGAMSVRLPHLEAFRQGLREHGYVEGKNLVIEVRFAEGKLERLSGLAAELAGLKVDVIAAGTTRAMHAAKETTATIPIIMVGASDPVSSGLVVSLARPGGNVTGLSLLATELGGKRLELLKDGLPTIQRVGVLDSGTGGTFALQLKETESAAKALGVQLQLFKLQGANDFDAAFSRLRKEQIHALTVPTAPLFDANIKKFADLTTINRVPTIYGFTEFADAGGLMSYGPSLPDIYRRAATYVDKILKGRKPADLPVEQPTKFELVINLKTAKQIGLTIPPNVLARADKVIK
jgi:putative tryptophan/tyrosine transport system substrate-binding protein